MRRSGRRVSLLILIVLAAAALGAYAALFTDWGRSLRPQPSMADACAGLPRALGDAVAEAGDCTLLQRTLTHTLATAERGAIARWINIRTGVSGTIKIVADENRSGDACRRIELVVTRDDVNARVAALACLKDGRWTLTQ